MTPARAAAQEISQTFKLEAPILIAEIIARHYAPLVEAGLDYFDKRDRRVSRGRRDDSIKELDALAALRKALEGVK